MNLTETDIKYLAGLLDADGSLCFHFREHNGKYNVTLKLVLQQSESIDKDGKFIKWLGEYFGFTQPIPLKSDEHPNWTDANRWTVTNIKELRMLIPRLCKHMVIKAKHWSAMLAKLESIYGKSVSEEEMEQLKEFAKTSRKNVGPLKPKKHPTWAWVAGYIDGDGCYYSRTRMKNGRVHKELLVRVVAHDDDKCSLELLHKAFGGRFRKETHENTHSWTRNLGNADRSFALRFLPKMERHSRLKRHKIQQMIHHHSQRLNDSTSTEEAIV